MNLFETLIITLVASSLFTTGATFMTLLFVHNVTAVRSRHLFSVVFALSGLMFFVILLDFTNWFDRDTTSTVLRMSLQLLLVLVVFLLPLLFLRSLVDDFGFRQRTVKNVIAVVALLVIYIFADRVLPTTEEVIIHGSSMDEHVAMLRQQSSSSSSASVVEDGSGSGIDGSNGSSASVVNDEVGMSAKETGVTAPDEDTEGDSEDHINKKPYRSPSTGNDEDSNAVGSGSASTPTKREATFTEAYLARASFFGVVFMAMLGGYAAVATPRAYLSPFLSRHTLTSSRHLVSALSKRHRHVLDLWASKQRQIALLCANEAQKGAGSGGSANANTNGGGGFVSWVTNTLTGSGTPQKTQLLAEVDGLSRVSLSLFMEISDAEETLRHAEAGKSMKGVLFASFGVVLSIYCVTKMALTSVNLIMWRFTTTDPVTRFFQLLSMVMNIDVDSSSIISKIALAFNAAVILSAMRGFLCTTFRMTTQYMSAVGANTTVLFFSLCMGLYFIALLLLMRLSLPEQNRSVLTEVIGQLPFYYYHRLNDVCFITSCVVTYVVHRFILTEPALE